MNIASKFPVSETTIFTVMSALAKEHNAINLSQGFPNFDCDERLKSLVHHYMDKGFAYNQYAPMGGVPALTQRLSQKIHKLYNTSYSPQHEITITSGGTQAISSAILALVHEGDEVILIEPAYDCYKPFVELAGATVVPYALKAPNWKVDWQEFGQLITEKTRLIVINTPHNPLGVVFDKSDFEALHQLTKDTNIILLSDEVYEHMVYDGKQHHSILSFPEMRSRSLAIYSFGKTLHATGWKLGYIVGDERLMHEFRQVHQYNVFSANTPIQYAIADYLEDENIYLNLPSFFQSKRDFFLDLIKDTPFEYKPTAGTYFQMASYKNINQLSDVAFAKWLTKEIGVAVIPISVFYSTPHDDKVIRFCFAKTNDLLEKAALRLRQL